MVSLHARRIVLLILLSFTITSTVQADVCGPFFRSLVWLKNQIVTPTAKLRAIVADLAATHRAEWVGALGVPPESGQPHDAKRFREVVGALSGEALEVLVKKGKRLKNASYLIEVPVEGGGVMKCIVKYPTRRDAFRPDLAGTVTVPRYETLAFLLDRHLGTNLVPPTITKEGASIQLWIDGAKTTSIGAAEKNAANLMDMSGLALLDMLIENSDRNGDGNMMTNGRRIIGFDFDLSRSHVQQNFSSRTWGGYAVRMPDADGRFGVLPRRVRGPAVFTSGTVTKLRELTPEKLEALIREAGFTGPQVDNIRSQMAKRVDDALVAIDRWRGQFESVVDDIIPAK